MLDKGKRERGMRRPDGPSTWLALLVAANVVIAAGITAGLYLRGESPDAAFRATGLSVVGDMFRPSRLADSWEPMLLAYEGTRLDPPRSLYAPFFEDNVKFQYPPTALLPLTLVPDSMRALRPSSTPLGVTPNERFHTTAGLLSLAVVWATVLLSLVIATRALQEAGFASDNAAVTATRAGLAVIVAVSFYPLVRAHGLGQVQVYLNALVAGAILAEMRGRPALVGICAGLCCLFKPQYGVILVWSVLRRRWSEAKAMALTLTGAGMVSLAIFGLEAHLQYLDVLRVIGAQGETYWANQSVNGLLNRFLYNGSATGWNPNEYAPYLPVVHAATLLTSAALVVTALASPAPKAGGGRLMDLLAVLLVGTMASPVAWEHHYGILLPVFAAAVPYLLRRMPFGRWTAMALFVSVMAVANVMLRPHLFFVNRWFGLAASHLFFGALLLLLALLLTRRIEAGVPGRNLRGMPLVG